MYLLFSVKVVKDFVFRDEIAYLQSRFPNLHVAGPWSRATPRYAVGWSARTDYPCGDRGLRAQPDARGRCCCAVRRR